MRRVGNIRLTDELILSLLHLPEYDIVVNIERVRGGLGWVFTVADPRLPEVHEGWEIPWVDLPIEGEMKDG